MYSFTECVILSEADHSFFVICGVEEPAVVVAVVCFLTFAGTAIVILLWRCDREIYSGSWSLSSNG
jgi:hypothetical protein